MLASWFERGLGQIVAPDEKHAAQVSEQDEEGETGIWSVVAPIVAPDPNYEKSRGRRTPEGPPPSAFLSPIPTGQVQCQHCHQLTPVDASTTTPATPLSSSATTTPLEGLVLSAAKETAISMTSPQSVVDARTRIFRLCGANQPLSDKLCHRLARLIKQDPSLVNARCFRFGEMIPDGYTPLMVTAAVNNVAAAQILLEQDPDTANEVDLQGRTALHIAAERGCMDMVDLLKSKHPEGPDAPVDLTGQTPLGRAVTSTHKAAQEQRSQLQNKLFSPGDVSVCGKPTPAKERSTYLDLNMVFGHADMPGFRVLMEDAISCHVWPGYALLGVCDGHGDQGQVSEFVAEGVGDILKHELASEQDVSTAWRTACLELDARLKKTGKMGGSTAVWALVTDTCIYVANVGDSRCILIQKPSLEQAMAGLTLKDEGDDSDGVKEEESEGEAKAPAAEGGDSEEAKVEEEVMEGKGDDSEEAKEETQEATVEALEGEGSEEAAVEKKDGEDATQVPEEPSAEPQASCVVVPMSEDHKPNLEQEQARIEKSGLSVFAETFMDNGKEQTIYKVQRTGTDRLAVSRAFGDFEYKGNTELAADEQAVVAVPDIRIHKRDREHDMFLVLCCDGVWDVMSNEEVADFVVKHAQEQTEEGDVLPRVGDLLLNECLERGSTDNMTVVIAALSKTAEALGGSERRALFQNM